MPFAQLKRFQAAKSGSVPKPTPTRTRTSSSPEEDVQSPTLSPSLNLYRTLSPTNTNLSPPSSAASIFASPPHPVVAAPPSATQSRTFTPPNPFGLPPTVRERQTLNPLRSPPRLFSPPLRPLDDTIPQPHPSSSSTITSPNIVPPSPIHSQSNQLYNSIQIESTALASKEERDLIYSSPKSIPIPIPIPILIPDEERIDGLQVENQRLLRRVQELETYVGEQGKRDEEEEERIRWQNRLEVERKKGERKRNKMNKRELEVYRRSKASVEQALSTRDQEVLGLRAELEELASSYQSKLVTLENTLEQAKARSKNLQSQLDDLDASHSGTRQDSSRELEQAITLATKAQADLIDRTQELEQLSHELSETTTRLVDSEQQRTSLQTELTELSKTTSEQLTSLREELTRTKTHSTSLEQTISSFEIKLSALSSHRDELQFENSNLQTSLDESRRKVSVATNEKFNIDEESFSLRQELSDCKLELDRLGESAEEADCLREELDGLQDQLAELVEDGEKAQQELGEANEMIRKLEKEREVGLLRVGELEEVVQGLRKREVERLEGDLGVEVRMEELEERYRVKVEECGVLEKEIEDIKARYAQLEATHGEATQRVRDDLDRTVEELKAKHERLTKELESQHEQILTSTRQEHASALEAFESAKQSRTNDDQSRLSSLEQELVDVKAHAAQLVSQGGQALADLERRTSELSLMQSERDAATHRAEVAETRFSELRSELEEARSQLVASSAVAAPPSTISTIDFPLGSDSSEREQLLLIKITQLEADVLEARRASDQSVQNIASQIGTINKLRREHTELVSQCTAESKRVTELRKMIEKKDFDSSRMGQDIVRLRTELASAKADTEASNRARRTIEQTLNVTRATNAGLERQVGEARALQVAAEASVKPLQETVEMYEIELDQKQDRIGELEDEVAMYVKRVNELEFSMNAVAKKAASSESKASDLVEVLENERTSHARALSEMVNSLTGLRTELDHARSSLESTTVGTSEADGLRARIGELESSLHSTENELAASQRELDSTQRDLNRLQESNNTGIELANANLSESLPTSAQEEMDLLSAELEKSREQLRRVEDENRELKKGLEEARRELVDAKGEVKGARKELLDVSELCSTLEERAKELETSLEVLKGSNETQIATISTLETELGSLRTSLSDREASLLSLRTELSSATESSGIVVRERDVALNAAVRRASKSERELKSLIASGDERLGELDTLRMLVGSLQEELASLRSGKEGTSGQVASLTDELERNVGEVESLRRLLEREKEATSDVRRALADLKEALGRAEADLETRNTELVGLRMRVGKTEGEGEAKGAASGGEYDLDALQQQAELNLSTARAQIRSLEHRLFEEEDARYELEKTNGDLKLQIQGMTEMIEDDAVRIRELEALLGANDLHEHDPPPHLDSPELEEPHSSLTRGPRAGSHRRVPSLLTPVEETSELSSSPLSPSNAVLPLPSHQPPFNAPVSPPLVSVSTPILDGTMSPTSSKRHVRQASLSLLKSRLETELGPDAVLPDDPFDPTATTPTGPSSSDTLLANSTTSLRTSTNRAVLQDNLVWCACCQGDLFVV
ncbi:hypothetical protein MVLG_04097 [Microbotryum lychnidis-dioicae p1A1 Lamole]|uniref:Uncharacterized protein n=1 Tax=Microbotryum lychnidis-dioicae (strain p1A1 Lamole / MvSl-1064) TaxID=683840 RepID=U5HA62_USTV1|nr:hypothetical protein MVLG_04097 [Microbotryum lychnidis-dioicae p1A1 Lamole]|eukprot:KDE05503.1 hypothetical protein MVLG_04097 [Microbotryum lychnidis-dioicae p1A1 Lamole]